MEITRGVVPGAKKVVIYGPEGIGKTTFASQFPDPVFIDTEGSTKALDVARLPAPTSWTYLKEEMRYVISHPDLCKTLVLDTADWAEKLAIQAVLDEHNKTGIEDFGYGNGYRYVFEKFGELLNLFTEVIGKNVNVVVTAHAMLKKFEQPDELGAYDRYCLKLIDSPKTSTSAALKEWADMVLFVNYKTIVVTDSKTKKTKAQGGQRVMYTSHHSCWDAKNRYGLPEEMPFNFDGIRHLFVQNKPAAAVRPILNPTEDVSVKSTPKPTEKAETAPEVPVEQPAIIKNTLQTDPGKITEKDLDMRIPKALRDLMLHDSIGEWDVENLVEMKGFVPYGTKIWDYENVNPGIIEGLLVAQWDKVKKMIIEAREKQEVPF